MKKSFTLIEIIVTVIVVLILATIGIGGYIGVMDSARQRTSIVNIQGLYSALEVYAVENGVLGYLSPEDIEKGYAKAWKEADWISRCARKLVEFNDRFCVYAQGWDVKAIFDLKVLEKYGARESMFTPPDPGVKAVNLPGVMAYGIRDCSALNALPSVPQWDDLNKGALLLSEVLASTSAPIVISSISPNDCRYKKGHEGVGITAGGKILKTRNEISTAATYSLK